MDNFLDLIAVAGIMGSAAVFNNPMVVTNSLYQNSNCFTDKVVVELYCKKPNYFN